MTNPLNADLSGQPIIIGAGLAGLVAALNLAPRPVTVLTKSALGENAASCWALGGLAAAILPDDNIDLHVADTLAAGDGLCDPEAVRRIVSAGPRAVAELERHGVTFDRHPDGRYQASLEAAHSRHRVLHIGGDTSGREIMRAVIAAVRATPSITVIEQATAYRLLTDHGRITGVAVRIGDEACVLPTSQVVLATGGLGGLWAHTTNPKGALGQGLALAAEAGAALVDLEFVQFHPTAVDLGQDPMPLASEALRGDGARLVDETGRRFMVDVKGAELAPRDVVARAVWAELQAGHQVYLDGTEAIGTRFPDRFPKITGTCRAAGIDPVTRPIPIRPAVHYHMGGIEVDGHGRTAVSGLWACGECAATGLHGANRLASNSLLEAVVTGMAVAADLAASEATLVLAIGEEPAMPVPDDAGIAQVRRILSSQVGVLRERAGLLNAVRALVPLAHLDTEAAQPALVGLMIALSALDRTESRGSHTRLDHPQRQAVPARRSLTLDAAWARVDRILAAGVAA